MRLSTLTHLPSWDSELVSLGATVPTRGARAPGAGARRAGTNRAQYGAKTSALCRRALSRSTSASE